MFKQVIRDTPLNTEAANSYFRNIGGEMYKQDATFVSTLRALVAPRIGEDDHITLSFASSYYTESEVNSNPIRNVLNAICKRDVAEGSIENVVQIHSFDSDRTEDNYANMELIKSSFQSRYAGWHRMEKVTDFFRKSFYVLCFVNYDSKNVYLFVDHMDIKKMHYLQCAIFAFLPWYFDPEVGVSELEMELINSLREKKPDKYEECLERIAAQYDFRSLKIRSALVGFETRYEKQECERVVNDISYIIDKINGLNDQIASYLRRKTENETRLLGLKAKINCDNSEDSEIMEYFLCNKKLVLEDVSDSYLTFSCMDYLTYFDEDMAKQMIENERSYVYRPYGRRCNDFIKAEDMKKLMYAIFIDQTMKMKLCAAYQFELRGNVEALRNHTYGYEFRECTPNTHTDRWSCMGNYEITINKLLCDHNYIGAIEQCVASCKSLNFADSTVMEEFMARLYGISDYHVNLRCIELPDGKVVEPKEAIEWLNAQDGEETEDE